MAKSRHSNPKLLPFALLVMATPLALPLNAWAASDTDLPALCTRLGDDDAIRDYSPSLRAETVKAYKALFPKSRSVPDDDQLATGAKFRCMNGKAYVCFIGANLNCLKVNTSRDNPGANEFCRSNPNADFVPLYAAGHNKLYSYRCRNGRAEITGEVWELDARGFANKRWTELPSP